MEAGGLRHASNRLTPPHLGKQTTPATSKFKSSVYILKVETDRQMLNQQISFRTKSKTN